MEGDLGKHWCTLTSLCGLHCLKPTSPVFSFGRHPACNWRTDDRRVSTNHCEISWNSNASCSETSITCVDNSTNGTFINGKRLGKGKSAVLRSGDVIALVVDVPDMTFKFQSTVVEQSTEMPITRLDTTIVESDDVDDDASAAAKTSSKIGEEISCGICCSILYKCVALVPCMHNFCGPCMREWSDSRYRAPCPKCRSKVVGIR
jgi:E3 ubiquitin-protein ligase CHFR